MPHVSHVVKQLLKPRHWFTICGSLPETRSGLVDPLTVINRRRRVTSPRSTAQFRPELSCRAERLSGLYTFQQGLSLCGVYRTCIISIRLIHSS